MKLLPVFDQRGNLDPGKCLVRLRCRCKRTVTARASAPTFICRCGEVIAITIDESEWRKLEAHTDPTRFTSKVTKHAWWQGAP